MSNVYTDTLHNIRVVLDAIRAAPVDAADEASQQPAIIVAPKWFSDGLLDAEARARDVTKEDLGEFDTLHGAPFRIKEDLDEPLVITGSGKLHRVLSVRLAERKSVPLIQIAR